MQKKWEKIVELLTAKDDFRNNSLSSWKTVQAKFKRMMDAVEEKKERDRNEATEKEKTRDRTMLTHEKRILQFHQLPARHRLLPLFLPWSLSQIALLLQHQVLLL